MDWNIWKPKHRYDIMNKSERTFVSPLNASVTQTRRDRKVRPRILFLCRFMTLRKINLPTNFLQSRKFNLLSISRSNFRNLIVWSRARLSVVAQLGRRSNTSACVQRIDIRSVVPNQRMDSEIVKRSELYRFGCFQLARKKVVAAFI